MKRSTYFDNNGFERYEDNSKLVLKGNHFYTDNRIGKELFSWNINTSRKIPYNGINYEGKILARQEENGLYDM